MLWRVGIVSPVTAPTWMQGCSCPGQGRRLGVLMGTWGVHSEQQWLSQRSEILGKNNHLLSTVLTVAFQVPFKTTKMTSLACSCWAPDCRLQPLHSSEELGGSHTVVGVLSPSSGGEHSCCPALSPGQEWLQCCRSGMSCFGRFSLGKQLG